MVVVVAGVVVHPHLHQPPLLLSQGPAATTTEVSPNQGPWVVATRAREHLVCCLTWHPP